MFGVSCVVDVWTSAGNDRNSVKDHSEIPWNPIEISQTGCLRIKKNSGIPIIQGITISCRVIPAVLTLLAGFARELHCWAAKESDINQRLGLRNVDVDVICTL